MPDTLLSQWLNGLAGQLRLALDSRIQLVLDIAPDCPAFCPVDVEQLEAALAEMVRRMRDVMPAEGTLHLAAAAAAAPPRFVLVDPPFENNVPEWLALSVGSDQAGPPDLAWQVKPPRADLARCARRWGAALSLLPHGREGTRLVLYLPYRRPAPT